MWRLSFLSTLTLTTLSSFLGLCVLPNERVDRPDCLSYPKSDNPRLERKQHIVAPNSLLSKSIFREGSLFSSSSAPSAYVEFTFSDVEDEGYNDDGEDRIAPKIVPVHISSLLFSESFVNSPKEVIPMFHGLTPYHYKRFSESLLRDRLSYRKFCVLEEKMAGIVFSYLGDTKHHWIIYMDPMFLYLDSIKSYGTTQEIQRTLWVTPSVEIGSPDAVVLEDLKDGKNSFI